jgi:putative ABC transport system permease protein
MLLALVFGLLSGALPAWKMSRLDPVHALKGAA